MEKQSKSIGQLVLNIYQELQEISLMEFIDIMFIARLKEALDYAIELGFSSIENLRNNIDNFLMKFFNKMDYDSNVEDVYNVAF